MMPLAVAGAVQGVAVTAFPLDDDGSCSNVSSGAGRWPNSSRTDRDWVRWARPNG